VLAERLLPEPRLVFDGARPIARTWTFCASCGEWLPTSSGRRQTEELIAALRLVTAVPELAQARLEHSDQPDLRLHLNGRTYGLEVTRIARGAPEEIGRAQWRKAVERKARWLMRERGNPPVWVSVQWRRDSPRSEVEMAAHVLVEFAEQQLDSVADVDDRFMLHRAGRELSDPVSRYLSGLTLAHAWNGKDDSWVSGFSNNPEVVSQGLQDEIDGKARLAAGYSRRDQLWLLVYAESANAAQALELTDEAKFAMYTGDPFDRVFFLDCMDRAAELRLA
jgi:hypothetical protein